MMPKFRVVAQFQEWQEEVKTFIAKDADEAMDMMNDHLINERGAETITMEVKKAK